MSKLNGWQRIYLLMVPLWCVFVYFYGNGIYGNRLQEIYVTSYVNDELKKLPKTALIESKPFERYEPLPYRDRTMPDGVVVNVHRDYTTDELEQAYQRAQVNIKDAKSKALQVYWFKTSLICLVPLLLLYLFGWYVGWVREGFKKRGSTD